MLATLTFEKNQKGRSTHRIIKKHKLKVKCHTAVQEVPLRECTVSVLEPSLTGVQVKYRGGGGGAAQEKQTTLQFKSRQRPAGGICVTHAGTRQHGDACKNNTSI